MCRGTSCLIHFLERILMDELRRDIPMPLVTSGVENGNLRELALQRMRDFGLKCRDVRNREVGLHEIHNKVRVSGSLKAVMSNSQLTSLACSRTSWN